MNRDFLGRPIRDDFPPDPPRPRLLTDNALNTIANDYRTLPLSEIGRHVMPLLTHVAELEDRTCDRCRFWVGHNNIQASRGECTNPVAGTGMKIDAITTDGERVADAVAALITPFDFGCRAWQEKIRDANEAQVKS